MDKRITALTSANLKNKRVTTELIPAIFDEMIYLFNIFQSKTLAIN